MSGRCGRLRRACAGRSTWRVSAFNPRNARPVTAPRQPPPCPELLDPDAGRLQNRRDPVSAGALHHCGIDRALAQPATISLRPLAPRRSRFDLRRAAAGDGCGSMRPSCARRGPRRRHGRRAGCPEEGGGGRAGRMDTHPSRMRCDMPRVHGTRAGIRGSEPAGRGQFVNGKQSSPLIRRPLWPPPPSLYRRA